MGPRFDTNDILLTCGSREYELGLAYWKAGKVPRMEVSEKRGDLYASAQVVGSGGALYKLRIEVEDYDDGDVSLYGECGCNAQYNCEHVAAALFFLLMDTEYYQLEMVRGDRVDAWLTGLKNASVSVDQQEPDLKASKNSYRLLYILEPHKDRDSNAGLQVVSQRVRMLKKGGYGKPSVFEMEQAAIGHFQHEFVQQTDKEIARLLVTYENYYGFGHTNRYVLNRDIGELGLQKMLLSDRCHWQDKDAPSLSLSSPRQIDFEWQAVADGQQLIQRVEPAINQVFHVNRLWYLDLERMQIGALEHPSLSEKQVLGLLDTPIVPEARLQEVSRRLMLEAPEYDLPTPVKADIDLVTIRGHTPRPSLLLHSVQSSDNAGKKQRFHCARLSFEYGPVVLEDLSQPVAVLVEQDDIFYRVERDEAAERGVLQTLEDLRFRPLKDDSVAMEWLFYADSVAHSAMQWNLFIEDQVPKLQEQGWRITIDPSFRLRFEEAEEWHAELEPMQMDWFALSVGVDIDGKRVNLLPVLVDILSQFGGPEKTREYIQKQTHFLVPAGEHRWLKVPSTRVLPIFDTLVELYDHEPLNEDGKLVLSRHQSVQIGGLYNDPGLTWHGAEELRRLNDRLRDFQGIQLVAPPEGFNTELRPYQQEGLSWLQFLREFELNGILADDMGLGKTVQTLAHLLIERADDRTNLVIAPTSLMGNWRREALRFAPDLRVLVLHGSDRHSYFDQIADHDVVLTTYPLLRRDQTQLMEHRFHYIVLDESQAIKNVKSKTTQIVYELNSAHRLCLTGTPMENHLGELWSMFHFLMPGFLGNLDRFNRLFRTPIERQGDVNRQDQLRHRIKPFMLRRTKGAVASELPEKTEIIRSVTLQGAQRDLYESIRLAMDKKVRTAISAKGLARSHIMILDALLKLRQVCCDPRLVSLPQAKQVKESAKLELLMDLLPEMVEEGRKVLLFSQFTKMLGLIENELVRHDIDYTKLTGRTVKRDEVITRFQEGEVPVFLISLKAGGVGLNLTAADTVIHYDPWWNPAVENQATDRAHRIGQDKAVFVYKLVTEDSVEEKILELQKKKAALASAMYSDTGKARGTMFDAEDLTELFKPLA